MALLYGMLIFALSCALTGLLRRYALATNLMDVPNHRSSHAAPTPRGGGVAFVLSFFLVVLGLYYAHLISLSLVITLLVPGSVAALLGFLDDRGSVPVRWRLIGHFAICSFALYSLDGMPTLSFFAWSIPAGTVANLLAILYLTWLLNLYNFMDGIDGIAAIEALTACLGGALLFYCTNHSEAALLPLSLAFAVAGFLLWNFPPAKIFMGDAGSGFLGLILGILSIHAGQINPNFFWGWLILLGVFIVDATVTLVRRSLSGEVLFQAHRNHAYQYASRYYGKHLPVTVGTLAINLFWLLPIALLVGMGLVNGGIGLLLAYLPLIALALKFKAGKKE